MDAFIGIAIAVQILLVALFIRKLGRRALGSIGFMLIVASFVYHGLTEITQAAFPSQDNFARSLVEPDSVRNWVLLVTLAMLCFTCVYLTKFRALASPALLNRLLEDIGRGYLLKWQVLLALGLPSFALVLLNAHTDSTSGYWLLGLTEQFTPFLLTLALTTLCLKTRGKRLLILTVAACIVLLAAGERSQVMGPVLIAVSTISRYGVPIRTRTLIGAIVILSLSFAAISSIRKSQGRFQENESFGERLGAIASSLTSSNGFSQEAVLEDSVYRFDGNSFGAAILSKRAAGFGVTGLTQLMATMSYMVPSFIYQDKVKLEDYMRNEEGYDIVFYNLDDFNWVCTLWTSFLCYAGPVGLLILAGAFGWVIARLDNWLARTPTLHGYLVGVWISAFPLYIEGGVSAITDNLRGLAAMLAASYLLSRGKVWRRRTRGQLTGVSLPQNV